MEKLVLHPMGGIETRELLERPEEMMLSRINNVGLPTIDFLVWLGFIPTERTNNELILMLTPEKILTKDWALLPQVGSSNPHLFTICLDEDEFYMHFLRQSRIEDSNYFLWLIN